MTQKQNFAALCAAIAIAASCHSMQAGAQAAESARPQVSEPEQMQMIFLKNIASTSELNDVQTVVRNSVPRARVYGSAFNRAITVRASEEDMRVAARLISEMDRPKRSYRVTYTITQVEDGKRGTPQRFSLVVVGENSAEFRQGNRVPILTGKQGDEKGPEQQFQYVDVGISIKCTAEAASVHSKIELSSVADEKSNVGIQDPVIRQTVLEGLSLFTPGKPQVIGTMDVPGSNRREEIDVLVEPL